MQRGPLSEVENNPNGDRKKVKRLSPYPSHKERGTVRRRG